MPLNAANLDEICTGGCMIATCKHEKHGEVFLHGRCHIHSTARMCYRNGVLHIICATCMTTITEVSVMKPPKPMLNDCHVGIGMYAHYKLMSGVLLIECGECHKLLQTIKVSRI